MKKTIDKFFPLFLLPPLIVLAVTLGSYFIEPTFKPVTDKHLTQVFDKLKQAAGKEASDIYVYIDDTMVTPNAYATYILDRNTASYRPIVAISPSMLHKVETEAELAYILSHELAHHLLGHTTLSMATGGQQSKLYFYQSKLLELNADRLGILIAAQAGYGLCGAFSYWKRDVQSKGVTHGHTHPDNIRRLRTANSLCYNL